MILSSDISDRAFEYLAFYLREYLQLYLLEKEPKYIPIWPPLVKQEDEYLVDRTNTKVYGCVMSGNDEPKTYIYNGVLSVPREIKYNDKLLAVNIDSNDILINNVIIRVERAKRIPTMKTLLIRKPIFGDNTIFLRIALFDYDILCFHAL